MPARFHKRVFASIIDISVGLALALVMSPTAGFFFAKRAEVMLRIGDPGSVWKGAVPWIMGMTGTVTYVLPAALYLVLLSEPFFRFSPGKLIFKLKLTGRSGPASIRQLWVRHLVKTSGLWLMIIALLLGSWQLAILALSTGLIMILGFFKAFVKKGSALHDEIAGTRLYSG